MNKKIKLFILSLLLVCSTGCTKYMKDGKEVIKYDETGQNLTSNILCKPSDENLYKVYEEHKDLIAVDFNELEDCNKFKINDVKYESLWESIFVKPLAYIILKLGYLVKNMGVSVMLIGLAIRLLLLPITYKSTLQTENMKKAQPELTKLEKKYKDKTDQESMMAKSQEMMMIYKKYNINPVSGCLLSFIQLPLFFAFLEAINRVPAIFEGSFLNMNLGMTPMVGLSQHKYVYILLLALIILSTLLTFKMTMNQSSMGGEADAQMKMMSKVMIITISIASLSLPTAIALYWIVTNIFAALQTITIRKISQVRK